MNVRRPHCASLHPLCGAADPSPRLAAANDVLGGEATHFTPWLSRNLDVLSAALGLDDLELVTTEADVAGKRLDILAATAPDVDELKVGVAIEAQYGVSDHDHLGKLMTYVASAAASYDRFLGVWLVDDVHPAHLAAGANPGAKVPVSTRERWVQTDSPAEWSLVSGLGEKGRTVEPGLAHRAGLLELT